MRAKHMVMRLVLHILTNVSLRERVAKIFVAILSSGDSKGAWWLHFLILNFVTFIISSNNGIIIFLKVGVISTLSVSSKMPLNSRMTKLVIMHCSDWIALRSVFRINTSLEFHKAIGQRLLQVRQVAFIITVIRRVFNRIRIIIRLR